MNNTVGRELFLSIESRPDGVRWELRIRLEREVGGEELKSQTCGGLVQGLNGTIESPGFPHGYPNYANCTWIIVTGERNRIQLSFHTFALEEDFDIVSIYDGQPQPGNLKMR
ncbi:CUB and sushi domain-containing protein 1 [Triplophysa rosa]|uniref:CUB and sushi domain-containing protein 1 n=1 Tax=Triplophysa rosa TaxID=992332 RepID=A0A9W7WNE2_TRIRA|nr:CUB and sushi domain-containing protein 1 [Triplophysa rosa]